MRANLIPFVLGQLGGVRNGEAKQVNFGVGDQVTFKEEHHVEGMKVDGPNAGNSKKQLIGSQVNAEEGWENAKIGIGEKGGS